MPIIILLIGIFEWFELGRITAPSLKKTITITQIITISDEQKKCKDAGGDFYDNGSNDYMAMIKNLGELESTLIPQEIKCTKTTTTFDTIFDYKLNQ